MATLKQRLHRKNANGTYDIIHLETQSDLVKRPNGKTVEQSLVTPVIPVLTADPPSPENGQIWIKTT